MYNPDMRNLLILMMLSLIAAPLQAQVPEDDASIIFWHHYADETRANFWQMLADEYNNAHPQAIPVEVAFFPSYSHQHDAILAGLLNGTLPDVAFVQNYHAQLYQLSDALVNLSSFWPGDGSLNEISAPFLEQNLYPRDGELWLLGLPITQSATAVFVNMDALRELGFDVPPRSLVEMGAMACVFHDGRGWGDVELIAPAGFDFPRDPGFLMALGANPLSSATSIVIEDALTTLLDLQARGCMSTFIQTRAEMQQRFASGQTLFYIDSSSARPFIEAAIADFFAEPFTLEVVPLPTDQAGPVSNWSGPSLSIFRSTPEREAAAWDWVEWLAQSEQVARWAEVNHAFPSRRDVEPLPDYEPFLSSNAEWMSEPGYAGYDLIRDELVFAALAIFAGEDPEARLQSLTDTANQIKEAFQAP